MRTPKHIKKGVALSCAALLLAACSSDPEVGVPENPEEVSGKVTVWTYPLGVIDSVDWYQPYIDQFNEEYPNVEVEMVMQSFSNREEALVTALAGGNAPDVVYFNPDFIPQYAEEEVLLPLDDLRDDWDSFFDASLESMTWEDTLYGAPLLMQIMSTYCNTEVLDAAGVDTCPETWDEMREIAPAVKERGYYLTEYAGASTLNHTFYKFLWQAGGEVLNEDLTAAAFNSPEGLEALTFTKEMVDNGWVPTEPLSVSQPFEQTEQGRGELAYVAGANLTQTREFIDPAIIETVPPLSHKERVPSGSVGAWSIMQDSDSIEGAQAFVHFLSDPEFLEAFITESGYLPPREDIEGLFEDDPQVAEGIDYLDEVRTGVMHPQAREIIDVITPHVQSVLLEGNDPQAALDAAEEEVNALLERSS